MVATDEPYKGTTRRYLRTIEHDSLQHSLAAQKMLIKGDLVGIPAVSYNFFRDSVLPVVNKFHVPDFNLVLNSVYAACVESKLIVNKRFAFFTDGPAVIKQKSKLADERETESTIFANMQSLWRKVAEQAATIITKLNPTVIYTQTPNANALMERPEGFKPDAISLLAKSMMPEGYGNTLRYYLCNAAVLEEERITDTPANREENLSKLLLACNHVFVNDPLRRAAYGTTIEDTNLRLYFFCRSGAIVSEPMNWVMNPRELIGIIIRFTYATEAALGFDESMSRYRIEDESEEFSLQYIIRIGNKRFRTVGRPLSDRRANFFASRGTRVFAAIEIDSSGRDVTQGEPDVVIKVYWPKDNIEKDNDSEKEGVRIKFFKHLAAATGDDHYFPDIIVDGYAQATDGDGISGDDTTKRFIRGDLEKESKGFYPGPTPINEPRPGTNPIEGSSRYDSVSDIFNVPQKESVTGISNQNYTEPDVKKFIELRWVNRVQYRIAFRGVGKTLAELPTMYDVFRALLEGVRAIRVLHRLGYVHRDISIGNFLVYISEKDPRWRLVLNDFEYVRMIAVFDEGEQILTGTRQFMSLEVLARQYLHYTTGRQKRAAREGRQVTTTVDTSEPRWDFHYNPLHDLEPFYWILLWFLLYSLPAHPSEKLERKNVNEQLDTANTLFSESTPNGGPSFMRTGCLTGGAFTLGSVLSVIPKDFADMDLKNCAGQLADHIMACYESIEGLPNFNGANTPELLKMCPDWMYDGLEKILEKYVNKLAENPIEIVIASRMPTDTEIAQKEEAEKARAEKEKEKLEKQLEAERAKADKQKHKGQESKRGGHAQKKKPQDNKNQPTA